jgi:hypothetical protein
VKGKDPLGRCANNDLFYKFHGYFTTAGAAVAFVGAQVLMNWATLEIS